ncbi:hypothetical protein GW17_00007065 [Ensete ventricosum]|nr:hypothetical protein GW17_00007065 [Ensete ventricosum]RZS22292.1 hypothetical protein BHM03_00055044 [Ensete ventricosum]
MVIAAVAAAAMQKPIINRWNLFYDQRASKDDERHRGRAQQNAQESHSDPPPKRSTLTGTALGKHPRKPPGFAITQPHVIPIHLPRPRLRLQIHDALDVLSSVCHRPANRSTDHPSNGRNLVTDLQFAPKKENRMVGMETLEGEEGPAPLLDSRSRKPQWLKPLPKTLLIGKNRERERAGRRGKRWVVFGPGERLSGTTDNDIPKREPQIPVVGPVHVMRSRVGPWVRDPQRGDGEKDSLLHSLVTPVKHWMKTLDPKIWKEFSWRENK